LTAMKNVLVLVFSDLKHDARLTRQVTWLKKMHRVTLVCFDADDMEGVNIHRIRQTRLSMPRKTLLAVALLLRLHGLAYRIFHDYEGVLQSCMDIRYDLVLANDIDTLPLAFRMKAAKIAFDAHEYAPRHFENNKVWKIFFQPFYAALCRKYIPRIDAMFTVGEGLAKEYAKHFGVRPTIITNATRFHDIRPSEVSENSIRLIHHGIVNESRKLELMIELMRNLDERFQLDLILMTSNYASQKTRTYIQSLKDQIEKTPRMRVLPAVKSHEVVRTINSYDMGVFLIPPINFNYANTLPNKLFDFIQARLAIAIGPTPEMASIVNRFSNGIVSDSFDPKALALKMNVLTREDIVRMKNQSTLAARELNAEKNETIFDEVMNKLIPPSS
jgi:glycosyltransferase involved in cell wall biosynthesis